jgi:UDP-glucose 4-epimerase
VPSPGRTPSLSGQRALVWGACGFIGRHLVGRLLAEEAIVTVLSGAVDRAARPAWQHAVTWLSADRSNPSPPVLERAWRATDVVYNLAGTSSAVQSDRAPLASLDETCRAQLLFLEACPHGTSPPHVIFVSTRLVYAATGPRVVTEDSPVDPRGLYAAHKLCVEHYHTIAARRGKATVTILRASPVFGDDEAHEDEGHGIIDTFIKQSSTGQAITVFGDGSQLRDFIYIDDFVDALLAASTAEGARNAIVNVGSGTSIRMRDAAEIVRAMTGGPPIRYQPWPPDYAAMESGDYIVDIAKARAVLGVSPRHGFAQGIALTLRARASRREKLAAECTTDPGGPLRAHERTSRRSSVN